MNNNASAIVIVGLSAVTIHAYAVLDKIPLVLIITDIIGFSVAFLTWVKLDEKVNQRRHRLDEREKELKIRMLELKIEKLERN